MLKKTIRPPSKFRVRRFLGLFWPIFDFFRWGNIDCVYDPSEKQSKSRLKRTQKSTEPKLRRRSFKTFSSTETEKAGAELAHLLHGNEVVAFFGDLGSGKTTFLKGLISALTHCSPDDVTSPTFTYLHVYEGKFPIYHFDLYRLSSPEEFKNAGFSDYLQEMGICCIEWAEKIVLPEHAIRVVIEYEGQESRVITIS
jgi:tRNA threonylcarbamoyladenosine biosynthesis protein TsaE